MKEPSPPHAAGTPPPPNSYALSLQILRQATRKSPPTETGFSVDTAQTDRAKSGQLSQAGEGGPVTDPTTPAHLGLRGGLCVGGTPGRGLPFPASTLCCVCGETMPERCRHVSDVSGVSGVHS